MSNNHLIIGLGGTGGKIIRALRKAIYEDFRTKEPRLRTRNAQGGVEDKPHPVKIAYLYVDSSDVLMRDDDRSWRIPGDTLQLGQASQLRIRGANLLNVLENLSAHPNIAPWIGSREQWRDILSTSEAEAAGGQKRRLGRFLFACRTQGNDGFVAKLRNQVAGLRAQTEENALTFHVCTGLAGGTGSGIVVDIIAQIRKCYPEDNNRVVVYALLPDTDPPAGWAKGNYHANGFGALLELNALSVGAYQPWDVSEGQGRVSARDVTGAPVSPMNGCYVFTNENDKGKLLNLERDEVSQAVASFLYQKIIMVNATAWADTLSRMENAENNDDPPIEKAPGTNIPERSKRFLTFGIKRLVIPEEEIREFLTFSFARQAVLQLQYNNWSKTQDGYIDSQVNEAFAQYVADPRSHERWSMTDGHLCLEIGILPMEIEAQWKGIQAEWNITVNNTAQAAMRGADASGWMAALTRYCEDFYDKNWRSKGVVNFYTNKQADQPAQASAIARKIEDELFNDWITGKRSMFDLGRILSEVRTVLIDKRKACEKAVRDERASTEETGRESMVATMKSNNGTWAKIGPIASMFGKRKETILSQAEVFKRFYTARHRIEAWTYARDLVDKLLIEIETLASNVASNVALLNEMVGGDTNKDLQDRFIGLKERIEARCKEDEGDLGDQVIKFYKARQIKDFTSRLVGNEDIQRGQAFAVRESMKQKLGERPTLAKFHQRLDKGLLLDLLQTVCGAEAEKAHSRLIAEDPRAQRILGNNIVDKLYRDYSGNTLALRSYIKDLVTKAGLYLNFDKMETEKSMPGAAQCTMDTNFTIIIPKAKEHSQFGAEIEQAFGAASANKVHFVEGSKANEITMIAIANLFPLRYSKQVRFLRQKYDERLAASERAKLELHSDGDGRGYPPLFLDAAPPGDLLALVLVARATNLIQELEDPETGRKGVYLVTRDARGRDNDPVALGDNEDAIVEKRDVSLVYHLRAGIQQLLQGEYLHRTKREEIVTELDRVFADVAERIPNPLDKRRKAYKEALIKAEEMLR